MTLDIESIQKLVHVKFEIQEIMKEAIDKDLHNDLLNLHDALKSIEYLISQFKRTQRR